jgi:hypothetical protein
MIQYQDIGSPSRGPFIGKKSQTGLLLEDDGASMINHQ